MFDRYILKYLLLIDSGLDKLPFINAHPPMDGKLRDIAKPAGSLFAFVALPDFRDRPSCRLPKTRLVQTSNAAAKPVKNMTKLVKMFL